MEAVYNLKFRGHHLCTGQNFAPKGERGKAKSKRSDPNAEAHSQRLCVRRRIDLAKPQPPLGAKFCPVQRGIIAAPLRTIPRHSKLMTESGLSNQNRNVTLSGIAKILLGSFLHLLLPLQILEPFAKRWVIR